jgi:hypothetical protein
LPAWRREPTGSPPLLACPEIVSGHASGLMRRLWRCPHRFRNVRCACQGRSGPCQGIQRGALLPGSGGSFTARAGQSRQNVRQWDMRHRLHRQQSGCEGH